MKSFRSTFQITKASISYSSKKQFSRTSIMFGRDPVTTVKSVCLTPVSEPVLKNSHSVLGLNIGLTYLAWARLECKNNELTHMDYFMFPESFHKMDPNEIYDLSRKVMKLMPEADKYVCEFGKKTFSAVTGHLQLSLQTARYQIISTIVSLLNSSSKSSGDDPYAVIFLKPRVTGKLFDLLMGNEMTSCGDIVFDLLNDDFVVRPHSNVPACSLTASEQIISKYKKAPDVGKELMGRALLDTLTFVELIIHENPKCVAKIQDRTSDGSFERKTV